MERMTMTEVTEIREVIARRLRHLKAMNGLSDREIGERIGMSREMVELRLCTRPKHTQVTAAELPLFADAFGVPVDLFYVEDDSEFLHRCADLAVSLMRCTPTGADRAA